jgi:hypothetical protein
MIRKSFRILVSYGALIIICIIFLLPTLMVRFYKDPLLMERKQYRPSAGHAKKIMNEFYEDLSVYNPKSRVVFEGILLVVQFNSNNFDKFSSSVKLRSIYKDLFDEIVFTGSPSGDVKANNEFNVLLCPGAERGYLAYYCLSALMDQFPNRKGYMMVHFDVLVNWPALVDLPRDVIWVQGNHAPYGAQQFQPFCREFKSINITNNPEQIFNGWCENQDPLTNKNVGVDAIWHYQKRAPLSVQRNYRRLCGEKCSSFSLDHHLVPSNQMGDILYVPSKHTNEFKKLSAIAYEANLFLEFATSQIFCGMDLYSNKDLIQLLGVPHNNRLVDWDIDYVFHQNPMHTPEGLKNLREQVDLVLEGVRKDLPIYGLFSIERRRTAKANKVLLEQLST